MSLIVCSKNDHHNLIQTLPRFLKQRSAFKEIILVDDFSTDDTKILLRSLNKEGNSIKYVVPEIDVPGKKKALEAGIDKASAEVLVFSDADCFASAEWSDTIAKELTEQKEIVLCYAPFFKENKLLNKWQRYECFLSAVQYLSYAFVGMPYMGVGRNLSYTKSLFMAKGDLNAHLHVASGDDDLTIQQLADKKNTGISLDEKSFVYSNAKPTIESYIKQKQRHYSSSNLYKKSSALLLGLYAIIQILFYIIVFYLLFVGELRSSLYIYLLKIVPQWILFGMLMKKFKETDLIVLFPILDLIGFIHYLYFSKDVFFPKTKIWSQRSN